MGVKKTGDFLEKATWSAAIAILALSLATNLFIETGTSNLPQSPNIQNTPAPSIPLNDAAIPIEDLTSEDDSVE